MQIEYLRKAAGITDRAVSAVSERRVSGYIRRLCDRGQDLAKHNQLQNNDLCQRVRDLEVDFQRQSQIVLELQSDIMSLMRSELTRIRERECRQQADGVSKSSQIPSNSTIQSHWDVQQNGNVVRSMADADDMIIGKRLVDLERKLERLQRLSRENTQARFRGGIHSNGSSMGNSVMRDGEGSVSQFNSVLDALFGEANQGQALSGGVASQLMAQMKSIEDKIHAQESRLAQMSGMVDVIRVSGFATPGMSMAPPHLYGLHQSPIFAGGSPWSLPPVLVEAMGLAKQPLQADAGEKDVLLEKLINLGAPGALWHASNEIVDDQPLVHENHCDGLLSFGNREPGFHHKLSRTSVSSSEMLYGVDRHVSENRSSSNNGYRNTQESELSGNISKKMSHAGCKEEPKINTSPSEIDEKVSGLKKRASVSQSSSNRRPEVEQEKERKEVNSCNGTCSGPEAHRCNPGSVSDTEAPGVSDKGPAKEVYGKKADPGGDGSRDRQDEGSKSGTINRSSEESCAAEDSDKSVQRMVAKPVPPQTENTSNLPQGVSSILGVALSRHKARAHAAVDKGEDIFGCHGQDGGDSLKFMEHMNEKESTVKSTFASCVAPETPAACSSPKSGVTSGGSDSTPHIHRSWSFPSISASSSRLELWPDSDEEFCMRKSLKVHSQSVSFPNLGAPGKNHSAEEEVQEMKNRTAHNVMSTGKCVAHENRRRGHHRFTASFVENPLFGKKWASLRCEVAPKVFANTVTNPLFDEELCSDVDTNGLPSYHAELSTQLVSISELATIAANNAALQNGHQTGKRRLKLKPSATM